MKVEWKGIPEHFWPDTEKPWRVSWGFGAFKDFPTEADAITFYKDKVESKKGDWKHVNEPKNVITD